MGFWKAYFEAIFGLGLGLTVLVWILVLTIEIYWACNWPSLDLAPPTRDPTTSWIGQNNGITISLECPRKLHTFGSNFAELNFNQTVSFSQTPDNKTIYDISWFTQLTCYPLIGGWGLDSRYVAEQLTSAAWFSRWSDRWAGPCCLYISIIPSYLHTYNFFSDSQLMSSLYTYNHISCLPFKSINDNRDHEKIGGLGLYWAMMRSEVHSSRPIKSLHLADRSIHDHHLIINRDEQIICFLNKYLNDWDQICSNIE